MRLLVIELVAAMNAARCDSFDKLRRDGNLTEWRRNLCAAMSGITRHQDGIIRAEQILNAWEAELPENQESYDPAPPDVEWDGWEKLGEFKSYQQTDEASITCDECGNDAFFILLPLAVECTNCGKVATKKEE